MSTTGTANDPFAQLERSHRRLEERLEDLREVAREAASSGRADVPALRDVADFFARAVRRHEDDEERSLFPRLAHDDALAAIGARLAGEHREHEALHARLDRAVDAIDRAEGPSEESGAIAELVAVSDALGAAYRAHVDEEERALFPAARAALDAEALDAIAREMAERRGGGGGGRGRGGGGGGGGRGGGGGGGGGGGVG